MNEQGIYYILIQNFEYLLFITFNKPFITIFNCVEKRFYCVLFSNVNVEVNLFKHCLTLDSHKIMIKQDDFCWLTFTKILIF